MTESRDARAAEGLSHLQSAMKEAIAAARAFLDVAEDVAEDLANDPRAAQAVASVVDAVNRAASKGRGAVSDDGADGDRGTGAPSAENADPFDDDGGRVQRIRIS